MEATDVMSSLSIVQQQAVANQINTTMMKKSLDMTKIQGQAMVELIEAAGEIGKVSSGKAPGLGNKLDVRG